jgi:hypothetical protein
VPAVPHRCASATVPNTSAMPATRTMPFLIILPPFIAPIALHIVLKEPIICGIAKVVAGVNRLKISSVVSRPPTMRSPS